MSNATESDLELQIGHVLLIDIVGYSKLLSNEQVQALQELNRVVRNAAHFRTADAAGKLIRIPTGDGMALLFFDSPEEPLLCALEISQALKAHPTLKLRMGAHSGPINAVSDVNDRPNFAGAGINLAQRVLDCGDAGHILLSDRVAEDLKPYKHWQPYLRDLGVCEVKHGVRLRLFNLCKDGVGNPLQPERVKQQHRRLRRMQSATARWVGDSPLRKAAVISGTVGAFLALVAVVWFGLARNRDELAQPKRMTANSIAVLPFENLSDDKQNAYFCDGVHDEILTGLSRVRDLKVISRTSVMQYRGKSDAPRNLREIARTLGVTHVLEGTVQRDGDRVRVSAQLIDPVTDTHVWADRYDRRLADVFAIESEIAQEIVTQLKATLSPEEKAAIEQRPTADIDAYDLYTRAKAILNAAALGVREKERLFEAEHLLKQAIARDPNFFLAYCLLARIHDRLYILGFDRTPARLQLAQTAIDAALKLRPTAGEGHLALAVHLYTRLDYARARQELDIAGRALPNEPLIFELRGYIDRRQGRWDDCLRNLREVEELDPRNYFNLQQIALALEKLRRFPDMISYLDRVLAIIPNDAGTRVLRALAELEWRADPKPLHDVIDRLLREDSNAARGIASYWLNLALAERDHDAAQRALASMTPDGCRYEGIPFPRGWCEGVAARARGDGEAARTAFESGRTEVERLLEEQPDYAEALCVLGALEAGLARKEEAIRHGERAAELLPVSKDAIKGALVLQYLALIYAWTNEPDAALKQLETAARIPSDVHYGTLRLDPVWDPLRGHPRFEEIVNSLAPK